MQEITHFFFFFKGDSGVAQILLEASMQLEILSKKPAYIQWCREDFDGWQHQEIIILFLKWCELVWLLL